MGQNRVLVVDDDLHLCRVTCYALEKAGFSTTPAYSLKEAYAAAVAESPQVIVLDLKLPDGDGCTLCGQLREAGSGARVLILTGQNLPNDVKRAVQAGASDYMTKPFSPAALVRRVGELLNRPREFTETNVTPG